MKVKIAARIACGINFRYNWMILQSCPATFGSHSLVPRYFSEAISHLKEIHLRWLQSHCRKMHRNEGSILGMVSLCFRLQNRNAPSDCALSWGREGMSEESARLYSKRIDIFVTLTYSFVVNVNHPNWACAADDRAVTGIRFDWTTPAREGWLPQQQRKCSWIVMGVCLYIMYYLVTINELF